MRSARARDAATGGDASSGPGRSWHITDEFYRLLVGSIRDYAVFALDTEGHIITWNPGAERMKGYTADDIIGRHFSAFYPDDDIARGKPAREIRVATETGRFEDEGWRLRKDGGRFWANVVITAIRDDHGTLVGFSKVTRDLSERKRTEEALRLAHKDLEAFSYTVSHDLRAPVRAMGALAEFSLRDHGKILPTDVVKNLESIRASATRATQLVEDLLVLARASQGSIRNDKLDVGKLAAEVAAGQRDRFPHHVDFEILDTPIRARGDAALLRVIFENLLGNAWKFTQRATSARIEVGHVPSEEEGRIVVFVKDNGAGFDPRRTNELFAPFHRLHTDAEFQGSGVGLATVRRIVERHGGRVWATSKPGEGATFFFSLPASTD